MGYGYGCCGTAGSQRSRSFLTKEERIELLKEYKNDLEKETQGVSEKIKELEVGWTNPFFKVLPALFFTDNRHYCLPLRQWFL